jgi:cell wall-associated NlpC family hydrolase
MFLFRYFGYSLFSLCLNGCNPFHEERTLSTPDTTLFAVMDTLRSADNIQTQTFQKADTLIPSPNKKITVPEPVVTPVSSHSGASFINTGKAKPQEIVKYAKTLIGIKYVYGSIDPNVGFDCSGFITYVFNHFKIKVPRSSIEFTNVGKALPVEMAKTGDIILFTGTNKEERFVGHMGIIVSNENSKLEFIHSTSGKAHGITITPFSEYYRGRFIKIIRVFPQNDL